MEKEKLHCRGHDGTNVLEFDEKSEFKLKNKDI